MNAVLSPCARNGQSPMAVKAANPEIFGNYAKSTLYGWIADGLFSAKKHDLPFAGTRRKPGSKMGKLQKSCPSPQPSSCGTISSFDKSGKQFTICQRS